MEIRPVSFNDFFTVAVLSLKARVVVELGTGSGFSSRAFLTGLEVTDGTLYTIDLYPEKSPIRETLEWLVKEPRVVFLPGDSIELGEKWDRGNIDVLLCDSDHSYEHVHGELDVWGKYSPKIIFIHDTMNPNENNNFTAPYFAGTNYAERTGRRFLNFDILHGLGVIV